MRLKNKNGVSFACDTPACLEVVRCEEDTGYAAGWVELAVRVDDAANVKELRARPEYQASGFEMRLAATRAADARDRREEDAAEERALHWCPRCAPVVRDVLEAAGAVGPRGGTVVKVR